MCGSCIAKVKPSFDATLGTGNWEVNTMDPKKILKIKATSLTEPEVIELVQNAGYKAEKLS